MLVLFGGCAKSGVTPVGGIMASDEQAVSGLDLDELLPIINSTAATVPS